MQEGTFIYLQSLQNQYNFLQKHFEKNKDMTDIR